ncbi:hypothetical protein [Hypericibacter sp.]|uniref:hypothetical protein n=1 Tax=Hypericibacter sp. TaxID=2705401 RepID=UPI003D6CD72C
MSTPPRGLFDILAPQRPETGPLRGLLAPPPPSANPILRSPVAQNLPMGRYGNLAARVAELRTPVGPAVVPGLWIEGSSPGEPAPHESIAVGDPSGAYFNYSFGLDPGQLYYSNQGSVYLDKRRGGEIYDYYAVPQDVRPYIEAELMAQDDKPGDYNLLTNNCRHFSSKTLEYLLRKYNLKPAPAPARTPTPSGTYPVPSAAAGDPLVDASSPGPRRKK